MSSFFIIQDERQMWKDASTIWTETQGWPKAILSVFWRFACIPEDVVVNGQTGSLYYYHQTYIIDLSLNSDIKY